MRRLSAVYASIFFLSTPAAYAQQGLPDFTGLVKENAPAVVNISTTKKEDTWPGLPPNLQIPELPRDNPLNEWLRKFLGERSDGPPPFSAESLGSGFIISKDGYIVTNSHLVEDANEIIVRLSDRRELEARMIGQDSESDIALLKIHADKLPVLKIGSSKSLKPGEWVLAIGSPFGFDHSVTAGIVSAKGRSLPSENYVPFIQTDVAINPGNSGGPLFNLDGEVVGVNSQIYSRTGGFMGLSFSIPIELAMNVVQQLKATGHVSRGWLGVYIQEVTDELAESFNMDRPTGALVARILPRSPAQAADLRIGDIILSYNGRVVPTSTALPHMVGQSQVGERVRLELMRDGKRITRPVTIGELPSEEPDVMADPQSTAPPARDVVLGLKLRPLTLKEQRVMDLEEGGLRVVEVHEGPAEEAGVRKGDVIQMIDNQKITTVAQFKALIEDLSKNKFTSVLVHRRQGPEFLALKIPG
ncbi:MAG: DegQ family serine endoprotease [Pseudomonadota bacterium]|nr:DegQ family serine endoprotease [Pseudomonadota bacterium]